MLKVLSKRLNKSLKRVGSNFPTLFSFQILNISMKRILLEHPAIVDVTCPFCGFSYYDGGFDGRIEGGIPRPNEVDIDGNPVELFAHLTIPQRHEIIRKFTTLGIYAFQCPECKKDLLHINPKRGKSAKTLSYDKLLKIKDNIISKEDKHFIAQNKEPLSLSARTAAIKNGLISEQICFKDFCEILRIDDNVSYNRH